MSIESLRRYRLSAEDSTTLADTFQLLLTNVDFEVPDRPKLQNLPLTPGVYFWTLRCDSEIFKIYVGKAKNISKRTNDYHLEFQPHSPNDFKLRFFQQFVFQHFPRATFDLWFRHVPLDCYTEDENKFIRMFSPLINERGSGTEEKAVLKAAFSAYFTQTFTRKLSK